MSPPGFLSSGFALPVPAWPSSKADALKTTVALVSSCLDVVSVFNRKTLPLGSVAAKSVPSGPSRTTCTLKSLVSKSVKDLPSFPTRSTVAGEAVPR